ncbi:MAG: restriction endonuclease [Alphaproteobacteria bacterium]|nr:restriction endonuclease [Alphaproteobacteria bacterium]
MRLEFSRKIADAYTSSSQRIRVLTEDWVLREAYCPSCGRQPVVKYPNNKPVADFFCVGCSEEYELKSKNGLVGNKIVDGAYRTMLEKILLETAPNFLFLNYDPQNLKVNNFFVIPKHFFTTEVVEKRKPLSPTARRAGWVGCNILLKNIPASGKIHLIRDGVIQPQEDVTSTWRKTLFLRGQSIEKKGWFIDIMNCIEKLQLKTFTLSDVYQFEKELALKHPLNKHIRDKIRQQLQMLRDRNYLEFTGKGTYSCLRE